MKTNNNLKSAAVIINNETIETAEVKNLCQMWKFVKAAIAKHGHGVRIPVYDNNDNLFMDITVRELNNGKFYMVNGVKETRRSQQVLAHRAAEKAKAEEEAKEKEEALKAKKAKKAAANKAYRERKKAEHAAKAEA